MKFSSPLLHSMKVTPSQLTVVYPVLIGKEEAFQDWFNQFGREVAKAPGFLGLGVETSRNSTVQTEWKVAYKFETDTQRDAWMESAERTSAQAEVLPILSTKGQETRVPMGDQSKMMMVVTARVAPERLEAWQAVQHQLNIAVAKCEGFESVDVFKPDTDDGVWTTIISFSSEAALERWKASEDRQALVERSNELCADEIRVQPGAFGQWFGANASPAAQSPAWKQAMVVLLVLYPLVTLYNITLGNAAGVGLTVAGHPIFSGLGLPFPLVVFLGNAVGTALLTWVVMPVISRVFDWWLNPFATASQTLRGAGLIILLYVIEIAVTVYAFRHWGF